MAATTCATLHFNALRATPARASRPAARCVPRTPRRADPEPPRGRERRVSRSETRRALPPLPGRSDRADPTPHPPALK